MTDDEKRWKGIRLDLEQEDPPDRSIVHIVELFNKGLKVIEIAYVLNCSTVNVYKKLNAHDIHATDDPLLRMEKATSPPVNTRSKKKKKPTNRVKRKRPEWAELSSNMIDPVTGIVVSPKGIENMIIGRMGDERVTQFVEYHMQMLQMRVGCDKSNVPDLYQRFFKYLSYCSEHGIVPNNMNCYLAIGLNKQDVQAWRSGTRGTPAHKEFADAVTTFFASIHEQGATDGVLNPISAMFWQKAHDGLIEASKLEVIPQDPLGEKRDAKDIAEQYKDILPEDA